MQFSLVSFALSDYSANGFPQARLHGVTMEPLTKVSLSVELQSGLPLRFENLTRVSVMARRKKFGEKIYSWTVSDKIDAQIPPEIIQAMSSKGWNAFGIYELVKEELQKEKRELRELQHQVEG